MGLIQHKREAYWFYRFLSLGYDRWVNPLFWTPAMRARALEAARLDDARRWRRSTPAPAPASPPRGSSSASTPRGSRCSTRARTSSPARARKPALAACRKLLGDAERLPFEDGAFDRYVSAGSIEYWPDPQRGIAEAHRVLRAGRHRRRDRPGQARQPAPAAALGARGCCSRPRPSTARGSSGPASRTSASTSLAPDWYRGRSPYARRRRRHQARAGPPPARRAASRAEDRAAPLTLADRARFAARFVLGSAAGARVRPDRRRARAARAAGAPR